MEKRTYYRLTKEETLADLNTSGDKGLSPDRASELLDTYGPNESTKAKTKSPLQIFADQFKDFMIGLLIAAAIISGIVGEQADTIAIVVILILNAVIGFVQEYRAEKAIEELQKLSAPQATVIREGRSETISSTWLVPGDIVIIETGNIVPADLRLIQISGLEINESILTGESLPVNKTDEQLTGTHLLAGDQLNMAFLGTQVSRGNGVGVVTATAMDTEIGKIAGLIHEETGKTPLQKRLARFGRALVFVVLGITAIIFIVGIVSGVEPTLMLLTSISLAVAAVPEALPAVITISLALGAQAMVKNKALVRKLPAVETLGSVTYICSDKTGTLTQNKMKVDQIYVNDRLISVTGKGYDPTGEFLDETGKTVNIWELAVEKFFMESAVLNNNSKIQYAQNSEEQTFGDPTELSLLTMAAKAGIIKAEVERFKPRVDEIPFDSERKKMTTLHNLDEKRYLSITKGAIEVLSVDIERLLINGSEVDISQDRKVKINEIATRMAGQGLRTLAIAVKEFSEMPQVKTETLEKGLTLLGIVGIIDPPRTEAIEAVAESRKAGIKPVMITGDHPATAKTIAERLGIYQEGSLALTGKQLVEMPLDDFEQLVEKISVYARVAPEHKVKIVQALKDKGQIVAMTGDGVNDAPALKNADIGIAMGITGTDVSKEAADMVLLDDNFATIVTATKEGRRIYDNIRRFIRYTLTSNSGEILVIFLAPFLGLPIPLLPIHILYINLVTDGLPGLAMAAESPESDIMDRPPRQPKESVFARGLWQHIIWVGLLMAGASLFAQGLYIRQGGHWQTSVFTVLALSQMGHALAIRSEHESLFKQGFFSNKPLVGAVLLTFVMQLVIIYVPIFNPIFRTEPLSASELAVTLMLATIVFIAVETEKLFVRLRRVR